MQTAISSFVLDDKALSCFSSWKEVSPEECEIFVHQIKLLGSYARKYFPETSSRFLFGWIWEESERLNIPGFKILYSYYEELRPWLKSLVAKGLLRKEYIHPGKFRKEIEVVSKFIKERCHLDIKSRYFKSDMYRDYQNYCSSRNVPFLSRNRFLRNVRSFLQSTYPQEIIEMKTSGKRIFIGISYTKDKCENEAMVPKEISYKGTEIEGLNFISKFIRERCHLDIKARYFKSDMYRDYQNYCSSRNVLFLLRNRFLRNVKSFLQSTYPQEIIEMKTCGKRIFIGISYTKDKCENESMVPKEISYKGTEIEGLNFIRERCHLDSKARYFKSDMYRDYQNYCSSRNVPLLPMKRFLRNVRSFLQSTYPQEIIEMKTCGKKIFIGISYDFTKEFNIPPSFTVPEKQEYILGAKDEKEGMVSKRKQICEKCLSKTASFNFPNQKKVVRCGKCKEKGMINIRVKRCKLCDLFCASKKYEGYCFTCYCYTYPDSKVSRKRITKQGALHELMKEFYPTLDFSYDKTLGACSKRRPDWFLDLYTHSIVIECDEEQHKNYEELCECKRLHEILGDLAYRPLVVLRINPDAYKRQDGTVIPSCFVPGANKPTKNLRERFLVLKSEIDYWLEQIPEDLLTVKRFFFDE